MNNGQKFAKTNSGLKKLYDAVCMQCGKPCKVPFKPTGKMGVSCSNCYDKNKKPFNRGKKSAGVNFSKRGDRGIKDKRSSYAKKR